MIDSLISFSEFALALAGFAAIALVLGRRQEVIPSGSAYVVQFMVLNALGPALLALLAAVLMQIGLVEGLVVRLCSVLYLVPAMFFMALSLKREQSLSHAGELVLPTAVSRLLWIGSILAHVVHFSIVIGFPFEPSVGLFLLGLWILLLIAASQFIALLFLALQ